MICTCGAKTKYSEHLVTTLAKAQEWDPGCSMIDIPITVVKDTCPRCGRIEIHNIIYHRGKNL